MGKLGWSSQGAPSFSRQVHAWNGRYEDSVVTSLSLALHIFCLYDRILFELGVDKGLVFAVGAPLCLAPLPPERHADAVPRMSVPPGSRHPTKSWHAWRLFARDTPGHDELTQGVQSMENMHKTLTDFCESMMRSVAESFATQLILAAVTQG